MRNAGLTLLCFLSCCGVLAAQMLEHTYLESIPTEVRFFDKLPFVIDSTGTLTIADLLGDTSLQAVDTKGQEMPAPPYYIWTSIQLTNESSEHLSLYIRSFYEIDSLWAYQIHGQQVVDEVITGGRFRTFAKTPAHVKNLLPVQLAVGETKTYYLRFRVRLASTSKVLHRVFTVIPAEPENAFMVKTFFWQSFYLGFMVLFCVLSVLMYAIFRDHIFLVFGALTLSFGGYFMSINRVLDVLIRPLWWDGEFFLVGIFISGIVLSLSFFIHLYLRLDQHFPKFAFFFLVFAFLVEAYAHISVLFISHNQMVTFHNPLLLLWMLACFIPIVLLFWRGDRPAKILLITITILFASAVLHILYTILSSNEAKLTVSGFQIGTVFFVSILFHNLFTKINTIREEKDRFRELDTLKSRFFANISHEFRTPLTLIKGPLAELAETRLKTGDRKLIAIMNRNADRLLRLINQLLDLSKLEAGRMELRVQLIDFVALVKGITMSFESLAQRKGIDLAFSSEQERILLWVDPQKIETIFNNLLSNAFKYTSSQEAIRVSIREQGDGIKVKVKDSGQGIAADRLPQIFNRFFQADQQGSDDQQGSGIGLALVKELVGLHGGNIRVKSIEKKGSIFTLFLPKGKAHLREEDITTDLAETWPRTGGAIIETEPSPVVNTVLVSDRKRHASPLILIIEDNADVRYYVKQSLQASYRIVEAVDGQDGIDKTLAYLPDLIISDVMMPIRNGYEVCRILKTDARTSHIPVILLTAKAAKEEKRQGLETGADDYLIKPFDTRELQVRVKNLIDLRRQLRVRFAVGETNEATVEPSLNAVDKAFMTTVFATLTTELANEEFSVDLLADAVGMSRRHLNRKLKALTDTSAKAFIRNYRLQEAMRMLKRKEGNVSEVGVATGFRSTAYFVKCFGDKYGQTPGSV